MRWKLIACKALARELSHVLAASEAVVDVTWIRQRLHDTPKVLRDVLQQEIDAVESGEDMHSNRPGYTEEADIFDAILLGYGLCSNAIAGLTARRHRLVIPRAHDCITLLLGSKERYREQFEALPGCFWYTASWLENADMPGEEYEKRQKAYYEKMGCDEETLSWLMEEAGGWTRNYQNAAYVRVPFFDRPVYQDTVRKAADYYHWGFHQLDGDLSLLERMLAGDWDPADFLVLEPGETAVFSGDEMVIEKAPSSPS